MGGGQYGLLIHSLTKKGLIFKLRTEAYTSTLCPLSLLTVSLTHSLICPHNALWNMLLGKGGKNKLLQGFRQQVTWSTLLEGRYLHWSPKTIIFLKWSLCNPGENLLLNKREIICTRSLVWGYWGDIHKKVFFLVVGPLRFYLPTLMAGPCHFFLFFFFNIIIAWNGFWHFFFSLLG